jgi:chromosome segregation ATPase
MEATANGSERIKQLYDEARAYIPDNPKYDEKYWVADNILHSNNPAFVNYVKELGNIKSRIKTLRNDLNRLNKIEKTWNKIQELYDKIKPFQEQIETLEEHLESIGEASYVISNDLYDLQNEHKRFLEQLREVTKQIII